MTNFDFLKAEPKFESFADTAISAERLLHIDSSACILNCRRAMEFAIKWMYSVDSALSKPYKDSLVILMDNEDFKNIVGRDIWRRLDFIRRTGNKAAHTADKLMEEQAEICLENLYVFLDFVAYCYADNYQETKFDPSLLEEGGESPEEEIPGVDFNKLLEENQILKETLTARRSKQQKTYVEKPLELSEYNTREIYIDTMLSDAGWIKNKDWFNEVELEGMPNAAGIGFADYVLYGNDTRPLAVIEAKRTCEDVARGRQQAELYADILEKKYKRRPVIFLTNGFITKIKDNIYPERECAAIYSKRDLEKLFFLQENREKLTNISVNKNIADRYYQQEAVKAVCTAFDKGNRRKALLAMATGSGKTRIVYSLIDVLLKRKWIKNFLFLADKTTLVDQAQKIFSELLPNLSSGNLCSADDITGTDCIFSTYQTMYNAIDNERDNDGRIFTCGHFDLIICDEAHIAIFNKYQDIFNYFDSPVVGLTSTPKDEIDKNIYNIFQLNDGVPTYSYELAQGVKDGYLVDYLVVDTKLKFIENGIRYDELSPEDKAEYEKFFTDEEGNMPKSIDSSVLYEWLFNEDTIKEVLNILMTYGLKVNYGNKIGKTIIFARNHRHAEKIFEVFNKEYPEFKDYAKVIDNQTNYASEAIEDFKDENKMPRIAISVNMMDTGVDVPSVLNLVFFKKVMSKSKFWQMIGRGTRLCPGLIDGKDKEKFYIFDFCGNFDFFMDDSKKHEVPNKISLQGAIFYIKAQIAMKLQNIDYQTDELIKFRKTLVADMVESIKKLNRDNFAVKQHLKFVEKYSVPESYKTITYADTLDMGKELAPLIIPDGTETNTQRFDALMFGIELAYLIGEKYEKARADLKRKVQELSNCTGNPAVMEEADFIKRLIHTDYIDSSGITEFENIRKHLRNIIKYIPITHHRYDTNFDDIILSMDWKNSENKETKA